MRESSSDAGAPILLLAPSSLFQTASPAHDLSAVSIGSQRLHLFRTCSSGEDRPQVEAVNNC